MRSLSLAALALAALPAAADTPAASAWTCRIERVIENSASTLLTEADRAAPSGRFTVTADPASGAGCLTSGAADVCTVAYTSAIEGGGILRLAATGADGVLDLMNIFTASGRFIRIHGKTQWMGAPGDCVRTSAPAQRGKHPEGG